MMNLHNIEPHPFCPGAYVGYSRVVFFIRKDYDDPRQWIAMATDDDCATFRAPSLAKLSKKLSAHAKS